MSKRAVLAQLVCYQCVFMSCRDYAPNTERDFFVGEYQRNFETAFGKISPTQHWDFSQAAVSVSDTRAGNALYDFFDERGWYPVSAEQISTIKNNIQFTDKSDQSFALQFKEGDCCCIVPVFQSSESKTGFKWELQVMADSEMLVSWPMGKDMHFTTSSGSGRDLTYSVDIPNNTDLKCQSVLQYENTEGKNIMMYFNLYITGLKSGDYYDYVGIKSQQSSLDYQMRIVNIPQPSDISDDYRAMFVACEPACIDIPCPLNGGMRYQALVFMVVGPRDHFPKVVEVAETDGSLSVEKSAVSKRYLIEDLGSTSDFDFNDVVVDVVQKEVAKVIIQRNKRLNINTVSLVPQDQSTIATISHLCGTLPLQVKVGDYTFQQIEDPTTRAVGWNPDIKAADIQGYDPAANNICVSVWSNGIATDSKGVWQVDFPEDGQVPFIMAVPIETPITGEGEMFADWKKFIEKE